MSTHVRYPNPEKSNFYRDINRIYKKYKIPKTASSIEKFCFPKSYKLQIPQQFLAKYINPRTPYRGLLVYHGIGSGKTCTAISLSLSFIGKSKILVVMPASLIGGFRNELRSKCAGDRYISDSDRDRLRMLDPNDVEYRSIVARSDLKIDRDFTIYSYNKFSGIIKRGIKIDLNNTLLIIDEVHNMISDTGTYYDQLYDLVKDAPNSFRFVIMTATPIFDKPSEIALTMNLLKRDKHLPTGSEFKNQFIRASYSKQQVKYEAINLDLFKSFVKGYVSYYRGAPPYTYPKKNMHYVPVTMSKKQLNLYKKVMKIESKGIVLSATESTIPKNFFIGVRMISNIVYPNNKIRKEGFDSMRSYSLDKMNVLSPKYVQIMKKIQAVKGLVFVYSNFKGYHGIGGFVEYLRALGYQDYLEAGSGKKRYAVWSGDQSHEDRNRIKAVFNNIGNVNGDMIKVILGSPSIKEGVTLLRVRQVHLMDPYWNWSRMDQIIGRAIRFCSHKDVESKRRVVDVYVYLATHPSLKISIDAYIMRMADNKRALNDQFDQALKEAAIDCELFHNSNVYPGERDIVCSGIS